MSLSTEQIDQLLAPLAPSRVQHDNKGMSHLAAWDVRRYLIRIFGPTGWNIETISCDLIFEKETQTKAGRSAWYVGYRVQSRLTIRDGIGGYTTFFEDGAVGDATLPTLGDAHDMAMKTALSQALKRCAMNLGDQFGLSLYNSGSTHAVVGRSLAHPKVAEVEATEDVQGDTEMGVSTVNPSAMTAQPVGKAANSVKKDKTDKGSEAVSITEAMVAPERIDAVADLCDRMDATESLHELAIVAEEIARMEPKPSLAELKVLTEVWKERKAVLSA
jgi:hypothetical protein